MIRRPLRPTFGPEEKKRLLDALGEARWHVIRCGSAEPYGSPRHKKCSALAGDIDELAEELTGERNLFHLKPHGGSSR